MDARPRYKRINVVGTSGVGKTTTSKFMAERIGARYVELDAIHWLPHWQECSDEQFSTGLREAIAVECWVADGNYSHRAREILWPVVDVVVWLDYSFAVMLIQLTIRSFSRLFRKTQMWHGNRESWRMLFSRDSIIWWGVSTFARRRRQYSKIKDDARWADLNLVRLRTRRQTRRWIEDNL